MNKNKKISVIIPAAGMGQRMATPVKKQFLKLQGKPILEYTLAGFLNNPAFSQIVIVSPADEIQSVQEIVNRLTDFDTHSKRVQVVCGGKTRQASVYNGLQYVEDSDWVIVHDGVRPFPDIENLMAQWALMTKFEGLTVGTPVVDTIKIVEDFQVVSTLERSRLWAVQTPQVFKYETLMHCHKKAQVEGFVGTDDASLLEKYGFAVGIYHGSRENIKITTPFDLLVAEAIIQNRKEKA